MPKITSMDDLQRLRDAVAEKRAQEVSRGTTYVTVGMGTCGIAAGARDVLRALEDAIRASHATNVVVIQTGCLGLCRYEPMLEVAVGNASKVAYGNVDPDMVRRIVQDHIVEGKVIQEFVIDTAPFPTI